MAVDLLEGEKVLYTKDYTKNRSRAKCSVTVTDRRVIHVVESKKCSERTEIKTDAVDGVKTKVSPASYLVFIPAIITFVVTMLLPRFVPAPDGWGSYFNLIFYAIACIGIVISFLRFRNGFNVIISTKNKEISFVSASSITGKMKPLKIQPDKNSAKELAYNLSAAIKNAKTA